MTSKNTELESMIDEFSLEEYCPQIPVRRQRSPSSCVNDTRPNNSAVTKNTASHNTKNTAMTKYVEPRNTNLASISCVAQLRLTCQISVAMTQDVEQCNTKSRALRTRLTKPCSKRIRIIKKGVDGLCSYGACWKSMKNQLDLKEKNDSVNQ